MHKEPSVPKGKRHGSNYIPEGEVTFKLPIDILCISRDSDDTNSFFQIPGFDYETTHQYLIDNGELKNIEKSLEEKYKNHMLTNSKHYKNCGECHIEPDWLLVYQYRNEELILLLIDTGSHSELFK